MGLGGYDVLGTGAVDDPTRGGSGNYRGRTLQEISAGSSDDDAYVAAIQANVDAQLAQQATARQQQAVQQQAAQQQQLQQQQLQQQQLASVYPDAILRGLRQNIGTVRPSALNVNSLSSPQAALVNGSPISLNMSMMSPSGVRSMGQIPKAPVYDPTTDTYSVDGKPIDRQTAEYMMEVRGDVIGALPSPSTGLLGAVTSPFDKITEAFGLGTSQERAMKNYGQLLNMGGEINPETGDVIAPTAKGELKYSNTTGVVTYSGAKDPAYKGAYQNLINPPDYGGDDDGFVAPESTAVAAAQPEADPRQSMIDQGYRYPAGGIYPTEGQYMRQGLLDLAPQVYGGLLAGYDPAQFGAMNVGFRQPTDVGIYDDPYDVTGYSLI